MGKGGKNKCKGNGKITGKGKTWTRPNKLGGRGTRRPKKDERSLKRGRGKGKGKDRSRSGSGSKSGSGSR